MKKEKIPVGYLTITEVAHRLHVHPNTLRRWDEKKVFKATCYIGPRGNRRYSEQDIANFTSNNSRSTPVSQ